MENLLSTEVILAVLSAIAGGWQNRINAIKFEI